MAHLVRPWVVHWLHPTTGKRVKRTHPGAVRERLRAKKWYGVGVPGYGKKRVPLASDKTAARRMLENLVRGAEQGQAGVPDPDAGRKRLTDHLDDFQRDVEHGLAGRGTGKKKRPGPHQVRLTVQRVRDILDGCSFAHVGDLDDSAPRKLAGYLDGRVGKARKVGGISHQTASFYLAAARRFVWWLTTKKKAPVSVALFDSIPGFEPDNNRIHARRHVTPEELARVLESALTGPEAEGLTGRARYHLYLTAFATGFRASELASLKPDDFDLDTDTPTVRLSGKVSKNGKAATQPLPPGVASQLALFLADVRKGLPIWPGKWSTHAARMLRVDLAAANVPYTVPGPDGPGYADFHSLRHSFLSALAAANVGPKVLQELARHSTARLTLEKYTHTDREQLVGAVARLPVAGTADPFAHLTRDQLLVALGVASTLLGWVFGPVGASPRANKTVASEQPPSSQEVRESA